jgi:hypothetical protein
MFWRMKFLDIVEDLIRSYFYLAFTIADRIDYLEIYLRDWNQLYRINPRMIRLNKLEIK